VNVALQASVKVLIPSSPVWVVFVTPMKSPALAVVARLKSRSGTIV
jgi:hypothetical protein